MRILPNVGRGYRAPTAFDLFSNGVHEGTVRFERGDSTLRNETSLNTDVAIRLQTQRLRAELGTFANFIDNFIFPDPTGEVDPESGFQVYQVSQGNARLTGFEGAADYHATTYLHLRATADYVRGRNTTLDQPLPFIPPFRATYSAQVEGRSRGWLQNPYFSLAGESNAKQTRVDLEDFAPDGYTLAHVGAGFGMPVGTRLLSLDLQLRNVFDTEYASFLSRYKTYALDPGRNFIVRISTTF
jgi:iron complex outermembrane receptor protein